MSEPDKNNTSQEKNWKLWFLVSFSLFLIVTFALYFPLRFYYQAQIGTGTSSGDHTMMNGQMMMGHNTMQHEEADIKEGLAVNLNYTPAPISIGVSTRLDLFVNKKPGNVPVPAESLELNHGKIMHLIGVRSDMNEFFHIHPLPASEDKTNPGHLYVNHTFAKPGKYKFWSEIQSAGVVHVFGHPEFNVSGNGATEEKKVIFSNSVVTGGYQVGLNTPTAVAKNQSTQIFIDLHSPLGEEIDLEDYLGVPAHMTIIKDDWKDFIHTHPSGPYQKTTASRGFIKVVQAADNLLAHGTESGAHDMEPGGNMTAHHGLPFDITFPSAGIYRIYVQFRPKGTDLPPDEALTAAFWLKVEEKSALPIPQWWLLLIVSVVLMAGLGWWVNRYLKVPADFKPKKKS